MASILAWLGKCVPLFRKPVKNPKARRFFTERRSDGVSEREYSLEYGREQAQSATTRVVGGFR